MATVASKPMSADEFYDWVNRAENVDLGKKMLAESGLDIVAAADMADGAKKAVAAAKGGAR